MNRPNFRWYALFPRCISSRRIPLRQSHWLQGQLVWLQGVRQVLLLQFWRVHSRSVWALIKDALFWLILLNWNDPVGFLSDAVFDDVCAQRIWTRLFMRHLHPVWAQPVNFWSVIQPFFFDGSISLRLVGIDGYPPLFFTYDLEHAAWLPRRCVRMYDVSVIWVIHDSEERRDILLVTVVLSPWILWSMWRLGMAPMLTRVVTSS